MAGLKRKRVKSFNKFFIAGLIVCFFILFTTSLFLFMEYRFFQNQSQEMIYLQEQYRKAISLVIEAMEDSEIDEKKKSVILSLAP